MSPLAARLTCVLFALGLSLPLQAATPPALSAPDSSPESPLGPEFYGTLAGKASVSAAGNASYVLPIELPPGTRDMVPQVSLNYNSNMRNGLLGLGWFLQGPTSRITRCPQTVSQDGFSHTVDYTAQDRFCLDGHRLVLESGTYGSDGTEYRTETDSFSRVISHGTAGTGPAYFTVETKDGVTKYYGDTVDSRVEAQGKVTVGTWALNRVEDAAGNYYAISYFEDNAEGAFFPTGINYTGNDITGLSPNVAVEFIYEDRPDVTVQFEGGAQISDHPKRLTNIKTYVDLALVSDYRLSYELVGIQNPYSNSGKLSRLTQIERCVGAMVLCQEPVVFEWWASGDGVSFNYYELTVPATTNDPYGEYQNPRWHDLNGDGTMDYLHTVTDFNGNRTGSFGVLLSGPGGYTTESWSGGPVGGKPGQQKIYWADVNGDGRTDFMIQKQSSKTYTFTVSLSTGAGFVTQTWATHVRSFTSINFFLRDMNGDKLLDLLVQECRYCDKTRLAVTTNRDDYVYVYLNTGVGFGPMESWATTTNQFTDLADMNGDGLTDLVNNGNEVRLNDGSSFGPAEVWPTGAATGSLINFYDYNGDGKADHSQADSNSGSDSVYYNTGGSFVSAGRATYPLYTDFSGDGHADNFSRTLHWLDNGQMTADIYIGLGKGDVGTSIGQHIFLATGEPDLNKFHQAVDVDGDGISEYTVGRTWACQLFLTFEIWNWCERSSVRVYHAQQTHLHLLKRVTAGQGAEVVYNFAPLTDHSIYTKYDTSTLPELDVQDSTHVVKEVSQSDGIGETSITEYQYEGLKRDLDGRGNLGFAKITSTSLRDGTTTITDYAQTFPYSSQPTHAEVRRTSDNRLLSSTDITYGLHGTVGSGTVFPYVDTRTTDTYNLGDGRLLSTNTTSNTVDMYGNITESVEETIDHENGDTFKVERTGTYNVDVANWRVGQLASQTVKTWLNTTTNTAQDRRTDFTYYPSTGFMKDTVQEPGKGPGIELTKTFSYDTFGNVITETLGGPGLTTRVTSTTYDLRGEFPLTLTNPLGHVVSRSWDPAFGTKLTETDANGQTTSWTYNDFGQQIMEYRPDGTSTETRYYEDNSGSSATSVLYSEVLTTGKAPVREFYDLLGRSVRTRTQGFDGSYVNRDTQYNAKGQAYRTSEPYFDGTAIEWNTNTYDFLGRVTAVATADPVKSVTSAYDGFSVSITDAQNRTKSQTLNAAGQVIKVIDEMGTHMGITYDPAGNRIQVTNAVGTPKQNSVSYTYDRLGRMLTQNDPDHGIYTYTYDVLGQKLSEISPKMAAASQSVTYQYDLLGRMTSRTEPEGTTTWTFDNTTGGNLGIGQLHSESSSGFVRTYGYGAGNLGRLTGTTTVIDGITFNTAMTYNGNGQIATETYPSSSAAPGGFQVEYQYNALGFQERVQAPGGGSVYYQMLAGDAAGRTISEWMGDGSIATQVYESASSRVTDQHTVNGATDIQHFSYTYDDAGNMTSRGDVRQGLSESFTFDDLDRLTSGLVAGGTTATYGFDVVGNITEKSDAGDPFLYTSSAVHAVTEITVGGSTQNLSYDPNGNLSTGSDVPTITWSSYNKPVQLTKGAITYTFAYGPDRSRYKKVHSGETTYYIGSGFEQINKALSTEYRHIIRANGRAIMLRKDYSLGGVGHEYIHRDHLGSVTALTSEATGAVIERYSYDAWGMRRDPTTWLPATITAYEQRGYTGHEHLDDIGIIHMNGRIYDPRLGRMLSPDPVTQAPENGQNYNRYSYAYNNPLKYSDPSGFEGVIAACAADAVCRGAVASAFSFAVNGLFGGNGCDRTCKSRKSAHNWCKAQSACLAELRANTREKFRRRSAQVMQYAIENGLSYYFENGRAHLGDNTSSGAPVTQNSIIGDYNAGSPEVSIAIGKAVDFMGDKISGYEFKFELYEGKLPGENKLLNAAWDPVTKTIYYSAEWLRDNGFVTIDDLAGVFVHELEHMYQGGDSNSDELNSLRKQGAYYSQSDGPVSESAIKYVTDTQNSCSFVVGVGCAGY